MEVGELLRALRDVYNLFPFSVAVRCLVSRADGVDLYGDRLQSTEPHSDGAPRGPRQREVFYQLDRHRPMLEIVLVPVERDPCALGLRPGTINRGEDSSQRCHDRGDPAEVLFLPGTARTGRERAVTAQPSFDGALTGEPSHGVGQLELPSGDLVTHPHRALTLSVIVHCDRPDGSRPVDDDGRGLEAALPLVVPHLYRLGGGQKCPQEFNRPLGRRPPPADPVVQRPTQRDQLGPDRLLHVGPAENEAHLNTMT